jgi:hypothetical protein
MKPTLFLPPSRFRDPAYMALVRDTFPGVEVREQKLMPAPVRKPR